MKRLILIALATACWPAVASAQHTNSGAVPAMYATKAEAEKAASRFNCTGAHQMGNQWMPCAKHDESKTHAH
ncbi:MAG: hypothetical protein EBZ51_11830 [Synechococcaceae bacterium WB9_2_112]|nr:hypothetical protein [Synechococcaceae bacterium WB9_2_112]